MMEGEWVMPEEPGFGYGVDPMAPGAAFNDSWYQPMRFGMGPSNVPSFHPSTPDYMYTATEVYHHHHHHQQQPYNYQQQQQQQPPQQEQHQWLCGVEDPYAASFPENPDMEEYVVPAQYRHSEADSSDDSIVNFIRDLGEAGEAINERFIAKHYAAEHQYQLELSVRKQTTIITSNVKEELKKEQQSKKKSVAPPRLQRLKTKRFSSAVSTSSEEYSLPPTPKRFKRHTSANNKPGKELDDQQVARLTQSIQVLHSTNPLYEGKSIRQAKIFTWNENMILLLCSIIEDSPKQQFKKIVARFNEFAGSNRPIRDRSSLRKRLQKLLQDVSLTGNWEETQIKAAKVFMSCFQTRHEELEQKVVDSLYSAIAVLISLFPVLTQCGDE